MVEVIAVCVAAQAGIEQRPSCRDAFAFKEDVPLRPEAFLIA